MSTSIKFNETESRFSQNDYNRMSPLPWFYNSSSKNFSLQNERDRHASFYAKCQEIRPSISGPNLMLNRKKNSANRRKLMKSIDSSSRKDKFLNQNGIYNQYENKKDMNKHLFNSFRFKAKGFKKIFPQLKDISTIDKYSRIAFPNLFLLFNIFYWCFYVFQSSFYYT